MGRNTDHALQQSFLEEAQAYLDTLETSLLGLKNRGIEREWMDGAMRAAHSIKGGAAMMELKALSQMAHRLEDCFKILMARRESIVLDDALETLLLQAVDCLCQARDVYCQGKSPSRTWWDTHAAPVFQQLQARLGDLQPEDENALLSQREGTNVVVQLFDTEVEPLLTELEGKIGQLSSAELIAEVTLLAEDLASLGTMIKLDALVVLCDRVKQHLQIQPEQVEAIATAALKTWRRSQAMIVLGHTEHLPRELDTFNDLDVVAANLVEPVAHSELASHSDQPDLNDIAALLAGGLESVSDESASDESASDESASDESASDESASDESASDESASDLDLGTEVPVAIAEVAEIVSDIQAVSGIQTTPDLQSAQENQALSPEASSRSSLRTAETTVRIPLKLLEQLNDLFGELLIGRNALNLRLSRMQSSVELLRDRVQNVEASNYELRTFQDQVTTAGVVPQALAIAQGAHGGDSSPAGSPRRFQASPLSGRADYPGNTPYFDILEKDHYTDLHLLSQTQMENVVQLQEVATDIDLGLADTKQVARGFNQTIKQLQLKVTQTRMRPLSDLMGRFPRMMRDLSVEYGKSVELKIYGGGTLIDRAILEALSDPLLHLLRNGFDHGIERPEVRAAQGKPAQGLIEIRAAHRGSQTIIQVRDDGSGINLDKIRSRAYEMGISTTKIEQATESELLDLIFEPGFSTADLVTDLSGRGVGMDVVRTNLQNVRGEVKVETYPGEGTLFSLSVPFTLSVLRVLVVESQGLVMAFPTDEIAEMVFPEPEVLSASAGQTLLHWNDQMVPLWNLGRFLRFNCPQRSPETEEPPKIDAPSVLVLRQGKTWMGLQVDRFWGEQEVAVRPIEGILPLPQGFAGSTILGDGRVVPLVDTERLLEHLIGAPHDTANHQATNSSVLNSKKSNPEIPGHDPTERHLLASAPGSQSLAQLKRPIVMVVDDSINVRRFLALNLERVGYRVVQAKDGQDAVEKLTRSGEDVKAMVCDLEMPRLDGYGVLSELRSHPRWKALPIIMLTSRSSEKHRALAMNLGASAYFSKPYNEQVLLDSLQSLLLSASPVA